MASALVVFAGGGTGGHLFPAIAIADEVKKLEPNARILFVGTKDKIEARVVPLHGYEFKTIWISGFHRGLRVSNLLFPLKVIVSMMQALSIIRNVDPNVVVGTGGFVSGPMLRAAAMLRVPTLIHEQNSYPGFTTRMLAPRTNEVHLTFESSKKYLRRTNNIYVSGNPTRNDLELVSKNDACNYFGFDPHDKKAAILMFGGSLGAHSINEAVRKNLDHLMNKGIRLIWQTGKDDLSEAQRFIAKYSGEHVWVNAFIERMDYAYAVSDLVVCRAGATTIAELTRLGKPSILVPYPHAAADHQTENARSMANAGAAEIVSDGEIAERLSSVIESLLQGDRLRRMGENAKHLGKPDAAHVIAVRVLNLARASKQE